MRARDVLIGCEVGNRGIAKCRPRLLRGAAASDLAWRRLRQLPAVLLHADQSERALPLLQRWHVHASRQLDFAWYPACDGEDFFRKACHRKRIIATPA